MKGLSEPGLALGLYLIVLGIGIMIGSTLPSSTSTGQCVVYQLETVQPGEKPNER